VLSLTGWGQFISPARPDHGAPRDAFTINNNNLSGSTTGCFKAKAFVYLILVSLAGSLINDAVFKGVRGFKDKASLISPQGFV